jgi:hypothetical protein
MNRSIAICAAQSLQGCCGEFALFLGRCYHLYSLLPVVSKCARGDWRGAVQVPQGAAVSMHCEYVH